MWIYTGNIHIKVDRKLIAPGGKLPDDASEAVIKDLKSRKLIREATKQELLSDKSEDDTSDKVATTTAKLTKLTKPQLIEKAEKLESALEGAEAIRLEKAGVEELEDIDKKLLVEYIQYLELLEPEDSEDED